MTDEPKQLPAPEAETGNWLLPVLVFFGMLVFLLLLLLPGSVGGSALRLADRESSVLGVRFIEPADGAQVVSPFRLRFAAAGLIVEPAGEIRAGAGHFHVLIGAPFVEAGTIIPNDEIHRHFGDGSTEVELDLPPGAYTLRLQFADGAHQALEGDQYRDTITLTVLR